MGHSSSKLHSLSSSPEQFGRMMLVHLPILCLVLVWASAAPEPKMRPPNFNIRVDIKVNGESMSGNNTDGASAGLGGNNEGTNGGNNPGVSSNSTCDGNGVCSNSNNINIPNQGGASNGNNGGTNCGNNGGTNNGNKGGNQPGVESNSNCDGN